MDKVEFRLLQSELLDILEARKAAPTGTVSKRADGDYEKQADGKWKRVSKASAPSGTPAKSPRKAAAKAAPSSETPAKPKRVTKARASKEPAAGTDKVAAIKQTIKAARAAKKGSTEKKAVSKETAKKTIKATRAGKTAKKAAEPEKLVSLPPPPPYPYSEEQRKNYAKTAASQIDDSRLRWESNLTKSTEYLSDTVNPGFTHSAKQFDGIRKKFAKTLTKEQTDACLFYSDMGDRVLNAAHRYNMWDSEDPRIKKLNSDLISAIKSHKLPEDTHVARGIAGEWAKKLSESLEPGDTFSEAGFTSTSATSPFDGEVQLKIRLPKGSNAAPIPTYYYEENEYLLPPGSKFKVVKKEDSEDMYGKPVKRIHVELVQ